MSSGIVVFQVRGSHDSLCSYYEEASLKIVNLLIYGNQISGCKGCWPTGIFKGAESDDLEGVDEEDVEEDNQGNDEDIVGEDAQGNDEDNVEEDVEEDVEEGVEEDAEEDTVEQDADEEIIRDGPPIIPVCELV